MVSLLRPHDTSQPPAAYLPGDDTPRADFIDELRAYGFTKRGQALVGSPEIGRIVRLDGPDDKRGDESGWYIYNEFPDDHRQGAFIGIGVFGSWKGNPDKVVWSSRRQETMTPAETRHLQDQIEAARIARDAEIEERYQGAAERAREIWDASSPVPAAHPYLVEKGIEAHGTRVHMGEITVPACDKTGEIVSLQFININGKKKFMFEGRSKGCFYRIGDTVGETVYVGEGFATVATVCEITGETGYVAFNAGNLMEVASHAKDAHPDSQIVVLGDDDQWTTGNPGREKANAAGSVLRVRVAFPEFSDTSTKPTDFNDMAKIDGREAVKGLLATRPQVYEQDRTKSALPEHLLNPPGILGDIAAYHNATSRAPQPGFAVQTALAVASVVLGRHFQTSEENFTSLYFLNVAKSGTGKEHAKTVTEKILRATNLDRFINGGGYTSAGAVFSTLLHSPKHITIIDEFGRYLEAAKGTKNTQLLEANTQLMEAIGRCHGVMQPVAYSTMTLSKEKQENLTGRKIVNPAITVIGMTTPVALFKNLTSDNIADGFLGRFIISCSDAPRAVHKNTGMIDVPRRIVDWIEQVVERSGQNVGVTNIASDPPNIITIPFTGEALAVMDELDEHRVKMCDALEQYGMEALPGRLREMGMKMSLIVALADNPNVSAISTAHARWASDYVRHCLDVTIGVFKKHISSSVHEGDKKEILQALREAGANGVTWGEMQKRPPYSKHKRKDMTEILGALTEGDLVAYTRIQSGKPGRPREAYVALA